MPTNQAQRPAYYEGQFLGAADLTAAVEYGRFQQARHDLGAHTWGIAVGLQLQEQPSAADPNQIDMFVQPGYAWDGFGRAIVVNASARISPDLFRNLTYDPALDDPALSGAGAAGRLVPVWLRYLETQTDPPRRGFELCDDEGAFARIQEGFQIAAGERRTTAEQRDRITLAGRQVDAIDALKTFDTNAGLIYDTSIPHQTFPDIGSRALWFVPLGVVRWLPNQNPNQPGSFAPRQPDDLAESRRRRRYVGLVAESLGAADGFLRLRDRTKDYSAVESNDLVWVEGSLRVEGDARLFGGKLEWRTSVGQDGGVPLEIRRSANAAQGATMLQVAIGQANAGANRFSVGPLQAAAPGAPAIVDEKFAVLDNGRVGIGTTTPALTLDIQGDFGRNNGPATLNLFGSQIGDTGGGILFLRSGGAVVAFDGGDQVGVGSTTPRNALAVRGVAPSQELISFEDAGGATKWHLNQNFQNRAGLNFVETGVADGRLFLAAGGNVGVGTVTPALRLDIQGDFGRNNGPATLNLFGSQIGDIGDGVLSLRSGGAFVAFDGGDDVGIGLRTALTRLHVQDSKNVNAAQLEAHVALMNNISAGSSASILALQVARALPGAGNNFITFFAGGAPVGGIQGDGLGGVSLVSGGADFAECLPRLHEKEVIEIGDIVGIVGGRVTRTTDGAHHVRAVSQRPIVLGNLSRRDARSQVCQVAMLGQVPVKVAGPVRAGDLILPSRAGDGVGVAVMPEHLSASQMAQVVGTAWESSEELGVKLINTAIGLPTSLTGPVARWETQQTELAALRREVAALRDAIQAADGRS